METIISKAKVFKVQKKNGYKGVFVVDPVSLSGGIALFWKEIGQARLVSYSTHHIDIEVMIDGIAHYRLTGFYGFPGLALRRQYLSLLQSLIKKSPLLWLVIGDFNDLLYNSKKQGIIPHPRWMLSGFQRVLQDCDLNDLGYTGAKYTWLNKRVDLMLKR